jgi:hypothetical protein
VVVRQINVESIAIFKAKNDPPVGAHNNRPKAFKIANERMQAQSRKVHVVDPFGCIQKAENIVDPLDVLCAYAFSIAVIEKTLKAFVAKADDHWSLAPNRM